MTGRTITTVLVDPEEWVAAQIDGGRPEFMARFTLGIYQAAEQGFFAGVDPTLATLLGRAPQTVREVLEPHLLPPALHLAHGILVLGVSGRDDLLQMSVLRLDHLVTAGAAER